MKRYISHLLYIVAIGILTSCSDFLDVAPKDKVLEEDQYSTEAGINGALNGLYRQFISTSLYGANLSQTALDAMGHYYTYPPTQPSDNNKLVNILFFLCNGRSEEYGSAETIFANVWRTGYNTLLNVNYFLKSMEESTAVIGRDKKDVLMGEAYGLRAYLHFDIFRLFGPCWEDCSNITKILPYSRSTDMILNHVGYEEDVYFTADEYLGYVLDDIRMAERLLATDPILTDDTAISQELISDFYKNRNRRMNYYAVKALEARVLQYMGDYRNAAIAAKVVTDQIEGDGNAFKWTDVTKVLANQDYSFFNEVVFGINNPDMLSNFNSFYNKTDLSDFYAVDRDHLVQNIYAGFGDNLKAIIDVRARQWTESNDQGGSSRNYSQNGTYISNKFNIATNNTLPALVDFQPLVRITEMFYIRAEAALKDGDKITAAELLNTISSHRGIPDTSFYYLTENDTDEQFHSHILSEYYKEFYGEGQVYFYHKRMKSGQMFPGYGGAAVSVNTSAMYNIPIPNIETDI